MNIAVCEDNAAEADTLCALVRDYCIRHSYEGRVEAFTSAEALMRAFCPGSFDLIFLDIFLPGLSGMDAARKIRETDRDCMLVFSTFSEDFAMEGFLVHAAGYILKPLSPGKIDDAMYTCRHLFAQNSRLIEIPGGDGCIRLSVSDLYYAEIYGKEAVFHMKRGRISARLPLDELETRLGGSPFLRCHRSYIVNMNYVDDMRDHDFVMRNGDVVPIRMNGRKQVRMAMARFAAGSPIAAKDLKE